MNSHPFSSILLGSTHPLPFQGHFRVRIGTPKCHADIAGRIAHEVSPEKSWAHATILHQTLIEAKGEDALSLIRDCWNRLLTLPRQKISPQKGQDLSLLICAQDDEISAISSVGLSGIWEDTGAENLQVIADEQTEESSHKGIPQKAPKVLTLPLKPRVFLATCLGEALEQGHRSIAETRMGKHHE